MTDLMQGWFVEAMDSTGSAVGFRVSEKLADVKTPYQHIEIYATTDFGNLMVIDGCIMLTGRENFFYHEMLVHPVLCTHPEVRQVAIIGGGDCGTLKEVLKHKNIKSVTQIDIDEQVTRLAEKYFPELCESNNDPRATLLFEDGLQWIQNQPENALDLLIIDSTDPVGVAEGLFEHPFYKMCFRVLKPGGVLVQQSESPLLHMGLITDMQNKLKAVGFQSIDWLHFPQSCYPSGWWSATVARKGGDLKLPYPPEKINLDTRYYNRDIHKAALAKPAFWANSD